MTETRTPLPPRVDVARSVSAASPDALVVVLTWTIEVPLLSCAIAALTPLGVERGAALGMRTGFVVGIRLEHGTPSSHEEYLATGFISSGLYADYDNGITSTPLREAHRAASEWIYKYHRLTNELHRRECSQGTLTTTTFR